MPMGAKEAIHALLELLEHFREAYRMVSLLKSEVIRLIKVARQWVVLGTAGMASPSAVVGLIAGLIDSTDSQVDAR